LGTPVLFWILKELRAGGKLTRTQNAFEETRLDASSLLHCSSGAKPLVMPMPIKQPHDILVCINTRR